MCYPDDDDSTAYYNNDHINTDKTKRILDWSNLRAGREAPATSIMSPTPKLNSPDAAEIREALRVIMGNRNIEESMTVTSTTTFEDTSTSTPWFTMRNALPTSTASIDASSATVVETTIETPAADLLSLKVATEDTTAADVKAVYDDEETSVDTILAKRDDHNVNQSAEADRQHLRQRPKTTTTTVTTTTKRRKRTSTSPFPRLDIPALLAIIANLTVDYNLNLTMMLNRSLDKYNLPTCRTGPTVLSTTETPVPTTDAYTNLTGTIMGKCFVCGLVEPEMPRSAPCADAFAGDFLPLVPVDPTARANIAKYRKYCRWMNSAQYVINASDPRTMWGRWTGGCSVRWIDLNGIYTQRTCRNRHRAVMGRHFVSHRMAKLEMALQNVDNGCIISPVASLVPISRGVSLYARFHVCVCTGNWCNRAPSYHQWTTHIALYTIIMRAIFMF
ncbi:uncharacterized protein LOC126378297 [Pectinophora gossypiella]|uniref:uncharacterized protein LOC126378297 n=1 Tax=Pectinophora gossypiella TaxID=13191 RepID=UPI00214E2D49|nr:uncharacterized protein LOC126378297 [Pectinophora gossypiella]